ncbi:uncharacterized protein LOC106012579 [Aplysia californica]|uniref:Uncharacterized protein LOC106012579 n=1 Tax=Aplysia californica TaxID=6500 RepID=A0ABM1VXT6_APLCA|nr:uncharacterized protein LOC106012579 [Aplysia californica]
MSYLVCRAQEGVYPPECSTDSVLESVPALNELKTQERLRQTTQEAFRVSIDSTLNFTVFRESGLKVDRKLGFWYFYVLGHITRPQLIENDQLVRVKSYLSDKETTIARAFIQGMCGETLIACPSLAQLNDPSIPTPFYQYDCQILYLQPCDQCNVTSLSVATGVGVPNNRRAGCVVGLVVMALCVSLCPGLLLDVLTRLP